VALGLFRSTSTTPRQERLRSMSLFIHLTPKELQILDGLLHERDYLKDEVIFDEGEEGQAIYIVLEGRVLICHQGRPEDGRIAELEPGTSFGELALLDNGPRSAQARADTDCRLAVFFREDFLTLLEPHAVIASKIFRELARIMGQRLRELATRSSGALQHL
jgi:CRP/FNR family transcriptional regulator, cyclic AMP receptor protein